MAEAIVRDRALANGHQTLEVRSAGTWAVTGQPPTPHATTALAEIGLSLPAFQSELVDEAHMRAADLVLAMTAGHVEALAAEFPWAAGILCQMSSLAGGRWDIADPVGGSLSDYRATRDELARLIDEGWEILSP